MPDYRKGQIYKICDVGFNQCYIGSSVEKLYDRMAKHRNHYRRYLEGKMNYLNVFKLFEEFGVENCKIYWIEDYPCNSKKELEAREGYWIEKTECVNKRIEGRTKQQWTIDNIEKIRKQKRTNYENNIEKKKEYDRQRYLQKKGQLLTQNNPQE